MRLRTQRKVIYVAMGLTVLALTGGYALASVSLGQSSTAQQGSITTTISPVKGLSADATDLVMVTGSNQPAGTTCSGATPCDVTSGPASDCAGGVAGDTACAIGTWSEEITLNTTGGTPFSGVVNITVYVTVGGTVYTGTTFYYTDSSGNTQESIVQYFGVGASTPGTVTSVSVVALE